MPNYRVGVTLGLRGSGYTTGIKGAASQTERFGGVVARTARSSTSQLRRTAGAAADVGNALGRTARRSRGALQRVAGAAAGVTSALGRTASAARRVGTASRRMADSMGAALGRARGRVNSLIERLRVLKRTSGSGGGGMGGGGGIGRVLGMAGGAYGAGRLVQQEADLEARYVALAGRSRGEITAADLQAQIEAGADAGGSTRGALLGVAEEEQELTGAMGPILEDLEGIARVLRMDPGTAPIDLGAFRALFRDFGLETADARERAMLQAIAGGHLGAMSAADLARTGASAATAQAEILGDRDIGAFFQSAQQIRGGFGNADSAMTALAMLTTTLATQREALTKQIGPVEAGTGVVELADRLAASVGGELSRLKGPFASIEIQRALAGITGEKGRATGAAVAPVFAAPIETLRADLAPVHDQQMGTTKAALEIAADRGARDAGGPLLDLWRPAVVALMRYQPQIHTGVAGVVALLAAAKLGSYGVQAGRWWRGQGGGGKGQGGGPAGGAPLSTVATMHVGTLVVRSMPGAGGGGRPGTPGTILSPNGQPAPRPTGGRPAPGGGGRPGRPAASWLRRLAGMGGRVGRGLPFVGAGLAGLSMLPAVASGDMGNVTRSAAGLAGGWGGMLAGAKGGGTARVASRPARRRWRRHHWGPRWRTARLVGRREVS